MTESLLTRIWRQLWNPPPPRCVQIAADAQADATSRLVKKIEREARRGRSLSIGIDRDLSGRHGSGHAAD